MRPKYATPGIVLARAPHGEANALLSMLTPEFGLVRARAQGLRKSGAKLAPALQTFAEVDAVLLHGKEGWRLSGATLVTDHCSALSPEARARAGRIALLLLRLVRGESADPELFHAFRDLLVTLSSSPEEGDAAECLAALRILRALGVDAGEVPSGEHALTRVSENRREIVKRINAGISASGL